MKIPKVFVDCTMAYIAQLKHAADEAYRYRNQAEADLKSLQEKYYELDGVNAGLRDRVQALEEDIRMVGEGKKVVTHIGNPPQAARKVK